MEHAGETAEFVNRPPERRVAMNPSFWGSGSCKQDALISNASRSLRPCFTFSFGTSHVCHDVVIRFLYCHTVILSKEKDNPSGVSQKKSSATFHPSLRKWVISIVIGPTVCLDGGLWIARFHRLRVLSSCRHKSLLKDW